MLGGALFERSNRSRHHRRAFFPLSTLEEKASVVLSDAKRTTRRRVVLRVVVFVRFEL